MSLTLSTFLFILTKNLITKTKLNNIKNDM